MKTLLKTGLVVCGLMLAVLVSGCERQGPMEKAGEKADEAIEQTGEAIEETGEEMQR